MGAVDITIVGMGAFVSGRFQSFRYAFSGVWHMVRHEPNAQIHVAAAVVVVALGACLGLPPRDWALIVFAICGVVATEAVNTAIERAVDVVSPNQHPHAKTSKDVAAAAVLIASVGAVVVGLLILGPPLWRQTQAVWMHLCAPSPR